MPTETEFVLIRHAPVAGGTGLAGRRDVAAVLPDAAVLAMVRAAAGPVGRVLASPARRCRDTAAALFPGMAAEEDPRLWEQDFGAWEGTVPPDLGPMPRDALAAHTPPGGESFADLCARLAPALTGAARGGRVAVVAHAGTVRGALALALGAPGAALAFEVAPLSLTLVRVFPGPDEGPVWSIGHVNRIAG